MKKTDGLLTIVLLVLPFIMPEYLLRMGLIPRIVKVWKIMAGSFSIIYLIKAKKMNKLLIYLTFFYLMMLFSALIHSNNILDFLNSISFLWIVSFLTETEEKFNRFCGVYKWIMTVFISINLFTMILYPNGLYTTSSYDFNWFLGYKNTLIRRILPFITVVFFEENKKKTFYDKMGIVFSILSIVLSKSFNGFIGLIVFFISFFVLNKSKKLSDRVSFSKIFLLYIVLDLIMLNTNILSNFNDFIVNVLDKNGSMMGRSAIWSKTIDLISRSPLIGYGGTQGTFYMLTFNVSHPHNLLLYYLMLGGIISVLVLYISFRYLDKRLMLNRKVKIVFISFYISMFSMGFLESLIGAIFLIPFISLLYNINKGEYYDRDLYTVSNK